MKIARLRSDAGRDGSSYRALGAGADTWNGVEDSVTCGCTWSYNNVRVHDGARDRTRVDSGLDTRPYCVKGEDSTY